MPKHTVAELKEAVPDCEIRAAFMRREDIAALPKPEREARWAEHAKKVDEFFAALANLDTFEIMWSR